MGMDHFQAVLNAEKSIRAELGGGLL
jgi:hypothetical protein